MTPLEYDERQEMDPPDARAKFKPSPRENLMSGKRLRGRPRQSFGDIFYGIEDGDSHREAVPILLAVAEAASDLMELGIEQADLPAVLEAVRRLDAAMERLYEEANKHEADYSDINRDYSGEG